MKGVSSKLLLTTYMYTSNNDISPIQDELLTDQLEQPTDQQKMIRVVELLHKKVRAMKETSNEIEQNPDQLQSEESQHFILVCQDGSSNSTQSIQEVSYEDQTAHTDRPQGSQTIHANTSTSSAGSKRIKTKKKVNSTQHSTTTTIDQTAHTNRPEGSQTTDASTSTSAAGSRQTKNKKKVSFR